MKQSTYHIPKMDCSSEESMIRMKLDEVPKIAHLEFDLANRSLAVFHDTDVESLSEVLSSLKLGSTHVNTIESKRKDFDNGGNQRKLLWSVLGINFGFFIIEMTTGLVSKSMGLVADSLDMLADSLVYGLSLAAVGGSVLRKKKIARWAGYFQAILALIGLAEVIRRFIIATDIPNFSTMIGVSIVALVANGLCLYLLQKSKGKDEAHMKASMIFTSNDIIINTGVILAGALVYWTQSLLPDLIVGAVVFIIVARGAVRIINLGK